MDPAALQKLGELSDEYRRIQARKHKITLAQDKLTAQWRDVHDRQELIRLAIKRLAFDGVAPEDLERPGCTVRILDPGGQPYVD